MTEYKFSVTENVAETRVRDDAAFFIVPTRAKAIVCFFAGIFFLVVGGGAKVFQPDIFRKNIICMKKIYHFSGDTYRVYLSRLRDWIGHRVCAFCIFCPEEHCFGLGLLGIFV